MARVGILGGSFNPPHLGHLLCAQEARLGLKLDRVVLVPAARPPHKTLESDPGAQARAALCDAAVAADSHLSVSRIELERGGESFTVDTLQTLHALAPGDDLTLIMGGDMAHAFAGWRDPEGILSVARLGVVERSEHRRDALRERLGAIAGARDRVDFFTMPRFDVSSSLVRDRVATGRSVRYLVPDAVADSIDVAGHYRHPKATP